MKITTAILFILVTALAALSFRYHQIIEIQDETIEIMEVINRFSVYSPHREGSVIVDISYFDNDGEYVECYADSAALANQGRWSPIVMQIGSNTAFVPELTDSIFIYTLDDVIWANFYASDAAYLFKSYSVDGFHSGETTAITGGIGGE